MSELEAPFDEPWQARTFAMAQAVLGDDDARRRVFQRELAASIAADPGRGYWESYLEALERFVETGGTHG